MSGRVYLVGAGPGDPGLLTARALELLARADVVLHDRLIPPRRSPARAPDAEVIDVGKVGGGEQVPQEETSGCWSSTRAPGAPSCGSRAATRSCSAAAARRRWRCASTGIPFEVVPGVTAGVAAPAYAGIPVTQRGAGQRGRVRHRPRGPGKPADRRSTGRRWRASPGRSSSTWACAQLPRIAERLIAAGRARDEPAAIVERGTLPDQRVVRATLGDDRRAAAAEASARPAITVVGAGRGAATSSRGSSAGRSPAAPSR